MNIVESAFQFALKKHEGQVRKGTNISYITHPFAVSMILKHHNYSDDVVAAGLLHDVLEDTHTTVAELRKFGSIVVELVQGASEADTSLPWEERKKRTISELPQKSAEQLAVIVADKLHNIRSIQSDMDDIGDEVWGRFNRDKNQQSWYYMSIVNALAPFRKEIQLVRILDAEVKRLFIGTGKLTDEKIDLFFTAAYHLSAENEDKLAKKRLLHFVREVKEDAEELYRLQDFEPLRPLMEDLVGRGVRFEMNSDGPFILLAFCFELQYRLGWDNDELYRHFKRNLLKL